jgi:hypothetical protein
VDVVERGALQRIGGCGVSHGSVGNVEKRKIEKRDKG